MKAIAQTSWRSDARLELVELPTVAPRPRELRVAVRAAGVNPVDWKMRSSGPLRLAARVLGPPPPIVFGIDFAGVVEEVGSKVHGFAVGDRVVGSTNFSRGQRGSYADTVFVRGDQICKLPENVDFETAASLPVIGCTARIAVIDIGRVGVKTFGDGPPRALVLGASGGVGQTSVQVAKNAGAHVVAVCSGKNAERVRALGADEVIDYGAVDAMMASAERGPYQVIVDAVGTYPRGRLRAMLGRGGRHAMVAGDTPMAMLSALIPPWRSRTILARATTARLEPLVRDLSEGRLRIAIAERLPLGDAERALEMSRGARMTGKIVLLP
jgi:NADPH:quinone reductase-like Zn-dependent oxidoreductase